MFEEAPQVGGVCHRSIEVVDMGCPKRSIAPTLKDE